MEIYKIQHSYSPANYMGASQAWVQESFYCLDCSEVEIG